MKLGLIDKLDGFEIIRDQIAAILCLEVAHQKELATAAGKDPALWDLRIFTERSNPSEDFREGSLTPIINIWYAGTEFDYQASDTIERQKAMGSFNIDIYAAGESSATDEGHASADEVAARNAQRALRLVRNILMSNTQTYLGLRGLVWSRRVQNVTTFQPDAADDMTQQIVGARVVFRVVFNEQSPQAETVPLEILSLKVKRAETGEILVNLEYDYNGD